ncbi:MAG: hypothetical protein JST87_12420 [Bacteroidetes bacterium]|nr:hypothetical protein [Bacteroidota bacterium]
MKSIQKKGLLITSLIFVNGYLFAQIDFSKFEIGAYGSAYVYQGDLTPSRLGSLATTKPGGGIFVSRLVNRAFAIRANFSYGTLYGNDAVYSSPAWRKERNFNFSTPLLETSLTAVWNILGKNGAENNYGFSPYLFAGIGVAFVHIRRDWSNLNTSYFSGETGIFNGLAEDEAHRLPNIIPVIPVGAGVRYAINRHFSANMEFTYRLTRTDYLDGFSKAADPSKNDHYYTLSAGLIYTFGKKSNLDCPKMKY